MYYYSNCENYNLILIDVVTCQNGKKSFFNGFVRPIDCGPPCTAGYAAVTPLLLPIWVYPLCITIYIESALGLQYYCIYCDAHYNIFM